MSKLISSLTSDEVTEGKPCSAPRCTRTALYLVQYQKTVVLGSNPGSRTVNRRFCPYHADRYARLNGLDAPGALPNGAMIHQGNTDEREPLTDNTGCDV